MTVGPATQHSRKGFDPSRLTIDTGPRALLVLPEGTDRAAAEEIILKSLADQGVDIGDDWAVARLLADILS